jgi:tetratricopeptide (TPR) repeat protein
MQRRFALVSLLLLPAAVALGESAAGGTAAELTPQDLFRQAQRAYREAADKERDERDSLYRGAADAYAALAGETPNGYVLFNLGNARFRLGEYGRAIAAYRRAEELLPRHGPTRRNLSLARANAPGGGPGAEPHPAAAAFFFWHYAISLAEAEWLAAFFFWALFAALSVRLFLRDANPWRKRLRTAAVLLGVAAGIFVLSSAAKLSSRSRPWVVVTAGEVRVKSEPAGRAVELFPLREGAEVRELDRAGDWTRIEAGRDRRGWVETEAVESSRSPPTS